MCVLSIKVPIRKKSRNLFNDPCHSISLCISSLTRYKATNQIWISNLVYVFSQHPRHRFNAIQGQSRVQLVRIQCFPSPKLVAKSRSIKSSLTNFYQTSSSWAGCDSRLLFKRSKAGLNLVFFLRDWLSSQG